MRASSASTSHSARRRSTASRSLRRALDVLGPRLIQFGSDRFFLCGGRHIRVLIDEVLRLLDELEVSGPDRERILAGTASNWLGLPG